MPESFNMLAGLFGDAIGTDKCMMSEETRRLAASDIACEAPILPACVLVPGSEDDVVSIVRIARREGIALHPRGGGWSYTAGYQPQSQKSVIVETRELQGIRIDREHDSVSVGAGVTWRALHDALAERDLRVPSFGPLSGIGALVGASVAQDGGFFGAASHGAVGQTSVAGVRMVDGHADLIELSDTARFDPVLAPQPLAGDCGAFGIKTRIDLRVIRRPSTTLFASFAFQDGSAMMRAMASLVGLPGLGEVFAFDSGVHQNLAATGFSILETVAFAGDLVAAHAPWWDRLGGVLRTARAGKAFLSEIPWSLHMSVDCSPSEAEEIRAEAARRVARYGAEAIPDVIPRVTRAKPFRPIKALVGPAGERWLPSHGLVEPSLAPSLLASLEKAFEMTADVRQEAILRYGFLVALLGPRITIEPQLFWPDSLGPYVRSMAQPNQVRAFGAMPENVTGRALAGVLRQELIATMAAAGAGHFQIGRTYVPRLGLSTEVKSNWASLKAKHDPDRIMNPGVLGL